MKTSESMEKQQIPKKNVRTTDSPYKVMQIQLRMQFSKPVLLILGTFPAKNDNDVNSEKDVTTSVSFKKKRCQMSRPKDIGRQTLTLSRLASQLNYELIGICNRTGIARKRMFD